MFQDNLTEQQHPLWAIDRTVVTQLLQDTPTDYNLAELARLKIRYTGFPGAQDIQDDLDKILGLWQMTEAELYEKTREIHARKKVYRTQTDAQEDWT